MLQHQQIEDDPFLDWLAEHLDQVQSGGAEYHGIPITLHTRVVRFDRVTTSGIRARCQTTP